MKNPSNPALSAHYSQALGLTDTWKVTSVLLDTNEHTLDIEVVYDAVRATCPECSATCPIHNLREQRSWRHLDMMQFKTTIHAKAPRTTCAAHGVKTTHIPWADAHSRFTLLFEHFAVEVLQATASITQAQSLLRLSWESVQRIRERAVERGLKRRDKDETILHAGIDEKSFLKGHHYASLATDLDRGRVLDVVEHRTIEAATELLNRAIPEAKRVFVEAIAMDMWSPFMTASGAVLPDASIVHDKFHIVGYLGKAVDTVRCSLLRTVSTAFPGYPTMWKLAWTREASGNTAPDAVMNGDHMSIAIASTKTRLASGMALLRSSVAASIVRCSTTSSTLPRSRSVARDA